MSGNRSDKNQIGQASAGTTGDKWRAEGQALEQKVKSEEKRHDGHADAQERVGATPASGTQSDDERVDETSEESFPASDPPQQP